MPEDNITLSSQRQQVDVRRLVLSMKLFADRAYGVSDVEFCCWWTAIAMVYIAVNELDHGKLVELMADDMEMIHWINLVLVDCEFPGWTVQ